jgi:hypothetical protein
MPKNDTLLKKNKVKGKVKSHAEKRPVVIDQAYRFNLFLNSIFRSIRGCKIIKPKSAA